MQNHRVTHD